ncbi:MAG: EamA family transporter, partial [Chloroflexota bacterium]
VVGNGAGLTYPLREPSVLPLLVFTGLFAAAIPSIMFLTGIRLIGGTRAGILMLFEPVVGVVLAALLLDERLAPIQVVGGFAILAAALVLQRSAVGASDGTQDRTVVAPAVEAD